MDRENFYKLLTRTLTTLEDEKYICIVSKNNITNYKDINFALVTVYDSYSIVTSTKEICFLENVMTSRYYDFTYYKTDKEEFNTEIISMEEIKKVLLQHIIDFPYLTFLYEIILEKYNTIKDKLYTINSDIIYINDMVRLVLSDEEIEDIIDLLREYMLEERGVKKRILKNH